MACARVCCILLRESRLLKWHVPVCAVFSQGRRDCSNGKCLCVLYSPRGDEIAQMACAHVCCILLGEIAQMVCALVCCILLGETILLKQHVPVCAVFSQWRGNCSNGRCLCVLYSPRGDEIAQMVGAHVCCILLGETRLLKWHVPVCAIFSQGRLLKWHVPVCAVFSQGRRDCSNGMCPCELYSPREVEIAQMACARVCCILLGKTRLLKWYVPVCAVFSQGRRDCSNGMCPCVLYVSQLRRDCSNGMCPCVLYSPN